MNAPWVIVAAGLHQKGGMDKANLALADYLLERAFLCIWLLTAWSPSLSGASAGERCTWWLVRRIVLPGRVRSGRARKKGGSSGPAPRIPRRRWWSMAGTASGRASTGRITFIAPGLGQNADRWPTGSKTLWQPSAPGGPRKAAFQRARIDHFQFQTHHRTNW